MNASKVTSEREKWMTERKSTAERRDSSMGEPRGIREGH